MFSSIWSYAKKKEYSITTDAIANRKQNAIDNNSTVGKNLHLSLYI